MNVAAHLVVAGMFATLAACAVLAWRDRGQPHPDEFDDVAELQRQQAARAALARATRTEHDHGK